MRSSIRRQSSFTCKRFRMLYQYPPYDNLSASQSHLLTKLTSGLRFLSFRVGAAIRLTHETFWSFLLYSGVSSSSVFVSLSIVATISFTMRLWLASDWFVVIVGGSMFGVSSSCMFALGSTRLTQNSYVSFVSIERSV